MKMLLDPETGELLTDGPGCDNCIQATAERIEAEHQLRLVERKLTTEIQAHARTKAELERQRTDTPEGRVATALGRYWITRTGKKGNAKVKDKRRKAVIDRIRDGYDPSYIARAIDGAAEAASTSSSETERLALIRALGEAKRRLSPNDVKAVHEAYRKGMKSLVRYDDLELVCRDETTLERFHDRAERVNAATLVGPAWLAEIEGAKFEPKPEDTPF
jgi:hypothetical protein